MNHDGFTMANQLRRGGPAKSGAKATGKGSPPVVTGVKVINPKRKAKTHGGLALDAHGTFRATAAPRPLRFSGSAKELTLAVRQYEPLLTGTSGIPYRTIAARSASENSEAVRQGIKPAFVKRLASDLDIDQSVLTDFMGFARSTFTRKAKKNEALSSGESAIALGVARIVGEMSRILAESGDPDQMNGFKVAEWTGGWLNQEVPALGNKRPIEFLDNSFGQETVLQLVRQMQSGAFA